MDFAHTNSPWNVKVGDYFYRIATDPQTNNLMWKRTPIAFFPDRFSEKSITQASFPPDVRLPYSFSDRSGGMGLARIEGADAVTGYSYSSARTGNVDEGVDTTLGSYVTLSAQVARTTLGNTPTAGGTSNHLKFYHVAYNATTYVLAGQYLYARSTFSLYSAPNSWVLVRDFGAGTVAVDIVSYRGTQGAPYLLVAFGSGKAVEAYSHASFTWSTCAGVYADLWCKIDDKLYRYLSGTVDYCTDGGATPTFVGPITVGDNIGNGNGLYNHSNRIVIGKSSGLFILTSDTGTLDQNLHPELWNNTLNDTYTFSRGVEFRNQLITVFQKGLVTYSSSFQYRSVGIDTLIENTSPVIGQVTAVAADLYHVYYALDSGYIIKGVVNFDAYGSITSITAHPWLYVGTTRVDALGFSPADNSLFALQGSQVLRMKLSSTGNQLNDSTYRFCPGGVLYEAPFYAGFVQENKQTFSLLVDAKQLSGTTYLQHSYKTDEGASYTELPTQQQTVTPGVRVDLISPPVARTIWSALTFVTSSSLISPILRSHTLSYVVLTDPLMSMSFTIDASEGGMLADGTRNTIPSDIAVARLEALINSGVTSLIDPWGRRYDVTIPLEGFLETGGEQHLGKATDLYVTLKAVTQKQRPRGTFAVLSQYKFSDLTHYTFSQLKAL